MLRYIGAIINEAREDARQELGADVVGDQVISDNALIRYCNYAIERITHIVSNQRFSGTTHFQQEAVLPIVVNQEAYQVDDNVYLGERYRDVRISSQVENGWWRELREQEIAYRRQMTGWPTSYIRFQKKILLSPIPDRSEGSLKVIYDRAPNSVTTRRALVTSAAGVPLTSVTLNNGTFPTDLTAFENENYFCVVDLEGVVKAYNIPFTNITTTTITVPSHALDSGESISLGNYIVPGKYKSTHPDLPDICEKYIRQYVVVKAFRKESSKDEGGANSELGAMEEEILEAFRATTKDQIEISLDRYDPLLG